MKLILNSPLYFNCLLDERQLLWPCGDYDYVITADYDAISAAGDVIEVTYLIVVTTTTTTANCGVQQRQQAGGRCRYSLEQGKL